MTDLLKGKKILLIIGGGISAYKCLDLIRLLKKQQVEIKTILTKGGKNFITPLSITSLTQDKVYFKHNGKTKRWWVLHDKWNKVVDIHMLENKGTDQKYRYISFAEWLKTEHKIGTGDTSFTSLDNHDSEFHKIYVWLARLDMGRKMQKFFKQNPKEDYLTFQAEC